ncbi:hypothetical protein ACGFNU_39140 [Spirillospora sp. NPDC048911]|uniref:hypothetical protein n=1 Tax=Spirillospora sp. NPDC048911 TaxID=3364527 RepID=UPI003712F65B
MPVEAVDPPFMPAAMVRWLRERDAGAAEPDKDTLTRWYNEFDASHSPDRRPPKFTKVLGALNATCFDAEHAVRRLLPATPAGTVSKDETVRERAAQEAVVRERVRCALAWLATPAGRKSTWLAAAVADPDPAEAAALLALDDLVHGVRHGYSQTFRAALFNVKKGPSADDVIAQFGEDVVRAALRAHLDDGSRPLLDAVRARLEEVTVVDSFHICHRLTMGPLDGKPLSQ